MHYEYQLKKKELMKQKKLTESKYIEEDEISQANSKLNSAS